MHQEDQGANKPDQKEEITVIWKGCFLKGKFIPQE